METADIRSTLSLKYSQPRAVSGHSAENRCNRTVCLIFEVFIAVLLKIQVLTDVTPCRLVSPYRLLSLKLKAL